MIEASSPPSQTAVPLAEPEFLSALRNRELKRLRSANGHAIAERLRWESLKRMIERGEYPRGKDQVRVFKESMPAPPEQWLKNGVVDPAKLEICLARGYSVIITHLETFVPPLAALCSDIRDRLSERVYAGAIVTKGNDGAFRVHYDPEDLIIIQVEGAKRWQVFGPPVSHPVRGMPKQSPPNGAPFFDEVLETGDVLLVPAGNWHHCENCSEISVHAGIFLTPPAAWHAAQGLVSQLLTEEFFRMPLTRHENALDFAAFEAEVKRQLVERISGLKLDRFVEQWSAGE